MRDEQSSAFSSRHSKPCSILSGFCCESTGVVSSVSFVSLSAMVSVTDNNKSMTRNTPSFFIN